MNFFIMLTIILIFIQQVLSVDIQKLFYEKDLSEYCKRRVIPSIFLGRHVMEASAFILHFSKLDLPYNCFISIRTESGNNIIMVLHLSHDTSLFQSCSVDSPQFLVYEMGETFGGYWGALPEVVLKHEPLSTRIYTLMTTQATTTTTEPSTEESVETTTPITTPDDSGSTASEELIQVEVPIVEVSGKIESGAGQPTKSFDFEEAFDYLYDVTPIPGEKYDTSILPLVQLSVRKQTDDGRREYGQEPRYDLDILEEFTPDSRLTLPQITPWTSLNQKYRTNANRRLKFGKNRATKSSLYKKLTSSRVIKNDRITNYKFPTTITANLRHNLNNAPYSLEMINKLMETLKKNKEHDPQHDNINKIQHDEKNTSMISEIISNMKHNFSIYLAPNLSVYDTKISHLFTVNQTVGLLSPRSTVDLFSKHNNQETTLTTVKIQETKTIHSIPTNTDSTKTTINKRYPDIPLSFASYITSTYTTESVIKEYSEIQRNSGEESIKISSDMLNETVPPVSLVDHESWENIVQVAPDMAVLLKQGAHSVVNKSDDWASLNETYRKELFERNKRAIHLISIENGRPHNLTTKARTPTTRKRTFNVVDMQEFARLVELQDDDMHGRVPLRYLKRYVGPAIYNICEEGQIYTHQTLLFNSSRIVLSLNNFTLSRMTVILTGARSLLSGEMQCPKAQLQCQVSGARVCVDSLVACDGVPNCGSYSIYDEDRLMCGASQGLQYNVYISAFTVVALALTLFYAVHYWLKQCVPNVAEAFFVYKDGIENILYLETIMRSPGDDDDGSKMFYRGNMFSGNEEELIQYSKKNICSRILKKCFYCFKKKDVKENDDPLQEIFMQGQKKNFSFTQMELCHILRKPTVDTSVQTGNSLEMSIFEEDSVPMKQATKYDKDVKERSVATTRDPPILINDSLITLDEPLPEDELSLMKFFRDSRSNSSESVIIKRRQEKVQLDFQTGAAPGREKEISSILYDYEIKSQPGPSGVRTGKKARLSSQTRRRIRFDEATTTIPSEPLSDNNNADEKVDKSAGWQVFGQNRTFRSQHLSTIKEGEEFGTRHRHFWEGKGKKTKKKTKVSLR